MSWSFRRSFRRSRSYKKVSLCMFISIQIKLIFIWKFFHEDSYWNWGRRWFKDGLLFCLFLSISMIWKLMRPKEESSFTLKESWQKCICKNNTSCIFYWLYNPHITDNPILSYVIVNSIHRTNPPSHRYLIVDTPVLLVSRHSK